jgi:predicted GH43/DUF377 family glycosyl hydrolase
LSDFLKHEVNFGNSERININLNQPVARFSKNPIITPSDVNKIWNNPAHQVKTVHNAGVTILQSVTIMLFRSHLRNGISVLGLAKSENGINNWEIDPEPVLKPATKKDLFAEGVDVELIIEDEAGGVEDPRIIKIDDEYAITYSAYHANIKDHVRVSLAITKDFKSFTRHGGMLDTNMRNVVIFPEKISDKYVALFRPNDKTALHIDGDFTQIRIGYTGDWKSNNWNLVKEPIMKTGGGPSAFANKIGPGAPPVKTKRGWISIFHGVRTTMDGNPYVLGVALHDLKDPARLKMSNIPILFPSAADCRVAEDDYIHVPNVVFTCGAIRKDDGTIYIYYGGNDTVMNLAATHEDVLCALCEKYAQDSFTGQLLYKI